MREILFRAKRIDNGEWVFGGYDHALQTNIKTGFYKDTHFIMENNGLVNVVDPESVCQYTGLTDKNGRKIFEGDILSAHLDDQNPEDITYVQITWDGFSWCMRESTEDDVMSEYDCNTFEVCGNIFENPELVESNT